MKLSGVAISIANLTPEQRRRETARITVLLWVAMLLAFAAGYALGKL